MPLVAGYIAPYRGRVLEHAAGRGAGCIAKGRGANPHAQPLPATIVASGLIEIDKAVPYARDTSFYPKKALVQLVARLIKAVPYV